jgi:hypothetical protein
MELVVNQAGIVSICDSKHVWGQEYHVSWEDKPGILGVDYLLTNENRGVRGVLGVLSSEISDNSLDCCCFCCFKVANAIYVIPNAK